MAGRLTAAFVAIVAVGASLGGAAVAAPVPTAERGTTEVVFLVDNSGMSASDWALLRRGYEVALADESAFPRDGSVSVGLVQYAGVGARGQAAHVGFPLTVLDSRGFTTVTKALRSLPLFEPRTAGKGAMAAAVAQFEGVGRPGAERNVCGTAYQPWGSGLLQAAVSEIDAAEIERVSMLGLGGAKIKPTQALQDFGGLVRGDGSVIGSRSIGQGLGLIAQGCLVQRSRVVAIEVNQVIQNWYNDIPLVEYKPTIARVFIESALLASATASGVLHGSRDGVTLSSSPLSPINSGGQATIDPDVANETDREDFESSLNFDLPTSWLSGDVELRFESAGKSTCTSPIGADCTVGVSFLEAEQPAITFASVPYMSGSTEIKPTSAELVEQMFRTQDAMPIRYVDPGFEFLPSVSGAKPSLGDVNDILGAYRLLAAMEVDPLHWWEEWNSAGHWYGVLDGSGGGLASDIPGTVSSGFLSGTGATEAYGYGRNRGPHELAHTYGAHHITNVAQNGTLESSGTTYAKGWCGEVATLSAPDFPFWSTLSGVELPTLGPLGDANEEVWGLAPRFEGDNENLLVINPYEVFPMLSYCTALDTSSQYRWPSVQTYEVLAQDFLGTDIDLSAADTRGKAKPGFLVRGTFAVDSQPGVSSVPAASDEFLTFRSFAPVLGAPTAATPRLEGAYEVRIVDALGKVLASRPFNLAAMEGDPAEPGAPDVEATTAPFAVVFPASLQARLASIEVVKLVDEATPRLLGSVKRSAEAPKVTIDVQRPTSSGTTISWTARDADSTDLSTSVYYRPNTQGAWKLVALDVVGDSVTIPGGTLPGSRTGQFLVATSDGVNSGRAQSKSVRVPDQRPALALISPLEVTLVAGQNAELRAFAYDTEDGRISSTVTWRLGHDTLVGKGDTFVLAADELPEGMHLVSVTVTDSAGQTVSAQAKVRVYRVQDGGSQG